MENYVDSRERASGGEHTSSSQHGVAKQISNTYVPTSSAAECSKPPEKKVQPPPIRSAIVPSSHHRSSHSLDRQSQSSSATGALDLQAVIGRSGSSISGITVPIRLDALSYLLHNAVTGAYKTPSPAPVLPYMYPTCPYSQMGCPPYTTCMNPQYCSVPFPNQFSSCQPGFIPCGNQPVPTFQQQVPNYNQFMGGTTPKENKSPLSNAPPQTGMALSSDGTGLVQENTGSFQSDVNRWAKKPNDRFGSNTSNSFSSESQQQNSPSRGGFARFGDKQNEDSWSGRQQTSFRRGFGRGRGDFAGQSWRDNSRGQDKERRFGDGSRNMDYGGQKRFTVSPERSQERGSFFKRGRWPGGRGSGGESHDTWQQRNREDDSPNWSITKATQDRFISGGQAKSTSKSAEDENWETDYPVQATTSKSDKPSGQCLIKLSSPLPSSPKSDCSRKSSESSQYLKPTVKSVNEGDEGKSDKIIGGLGAEPACEKEEGETDSGSEKADVETADPEPQVGEQVSAPSSVVNSAEHVETIEVNTEKREEDVYSFIISVDGDDSKGLLVEVNAERP
ncbi:uncharacterized protein LOC142106942 [Mixophyes fleayi]|uniref:uncharacterized protein LOC142106942 n=1 Tax=Mixophyes fleayi TaxID=3061075 RepID=UPI003F4D9E3E